MYLKYSSTLLFLVEVIGASTRVPFYNEEE